MWLEEFVLGRGELSGLSGEEILGGLPGEGGRGAPHQPMNNDFLHCKSNIVKTFHSGFGPPRTMIQFAK